MYRWICALLITATVGCTNEQLDYLGITDPAIRETLLALDDTPLDVGHGLVAEDGSYTASPCPQVPSAYQHLNPGPAMQAFRAVACRRGWQSGDIQAWAPFVEAMMKRESAFCPYLFRGDRPNADCSVNRHSKNSDAGFGQVIWRYAPWLGPNENIWSKWDIIASPTNSMTAVVALIEHSGRNPWCWTAKLKRGHVCQLAPH